jgi:hypothetical protein
MGRAAGVPFFVYNKAPWKFPFSFLYFPFHL